MPEPNSRMLLGSGVDPLLTGQDEGFSAPAAIAKVGAALPEVANRRAAAPPFGMSHLRVPELMASVALLSESRSCCLRHRP